MAQLYKHNLINEKGEDLNRMKIATKKEKEEKRALKIAAEMNVDPVSLRKAKVGKWNLNVLK